MTATPPWGPTVDDAPLPGATFTQAIGRFFLRATVFSGRASPSELWWTVLFHVLVSLCRLVSASASGSRRPCHRRG